METLACCRQKDQVAGVPREAAPASKSIRTVRVSHQMWATSDVIRRPGVVEMAVGRSFFQDQGQDNRNGDIEYDTR